MYTLTHHNAMSPKTTPMKMPRVIVVTLRSTTLPLALVSHHLSVIDPRSRTLEGAGEAAGSWVGGVLGLWVPGESLSSPRHAELLAVVRYSQ